MPTSKRFAWKDPSRITLVAMIIMAVDIVFAMLGLAIQLFWGELGDIGATPPTALRTPYPLILCYALLSLIVIFSTPVLVFWILRISKNAHASKGRPLRNSPLFAALWWYLIPFMSLFKPVEALGEIWDTSAPNRERGKSQRFVLRLWWGSVPLAVVAAYVGLLIRHNGAVLCVQLGISIVECSAFLFIARRIRDMQLEKHLSMTFSDEAEPRPNILQRLND
jgi:hypothetical protein